MANCRVFNKNTTCTPIKKEAEESTSATISCEPLSVCLGFGRSLLFDGQCWSLQGGPSIPDGVYNSITIQNGCPVTATVVEETPYVLPPCAPAAADCGDATSSIVIAPGECNLSSLDAAGRLVTNVTLQAGSGVSISGCGSSQSPAVISATFDPSDIQVNISAGTSQYVTVDNPSGNNYIISHVEHEGIAGTYGPYTFDAAGHLTAYEAEENSTGVQQIIVGPGLTLTDNNGVVTIQLSQIGIEPGTYLLGGYNVIVDLNGRVTSVTPAIQIEEGWYDPYSYRFYLNQLGSVSEVQAIIRTEDTRFTKTYPSNTDVMDIVVTTSMIGSFGISVATHFGTAPANVEGLATLPQEVQITVDGINEAGYAKVSNGQYVGIEVRTAGTYDVGQHTVVINYVSDDETATFTGPSMLDVWLTRAGT